MLQEVEVSLPEGITTELLVLSGAETVGTDDGPTEMLLLEAEGEMVAIEESSTGVLLGISIELELTIVALLEAGVLDAGMLEAVTLEPGMLEAVTLEPGMLEAETLEAG